MATDYTDPNNWGTKTNNSDATTEIQNDGVPEYEYLSAEEWNGVTSVIKQLKTSDAASVKTVVFNGDTYTPVNGVVTFNQSVSGTSYTARMALQSTPSVLQRDNNVSVNVYVTYLATYSATEYEYLTDTIPVEIQRSIDGGTTYNPVGTVYVQAIPDPQNPTYTEIDLKNYLVSGGQYIRMRAVAEKDTSTWQTFQINVINLYLAPRMAVQTPFESGSVLLGYNIGGAIAKKLELEIGHRVNGTFYTELSYTGGADNGCNHEMDSQVYMETAYTYNLLYNGSVTAAYTLVNTPGRHSIRARLNVQDTIYTDWVESEIMVSPTNNMVVINNINNELDNWSDVTFFTWAAYATTYPLNVTFQLVEQGTSNVYGEWVSVADTAGILHTLSTSLGLDIPSATTAFNGIMKITDGNGNTLANDVYFTINNNSDFAPVADADFVFQPASRSNSESNPQTIINAVDGSVIASTWTNFDMISDGYVEVEENEGSSRKVRALRVPAGRSLVIEYNPFKNLMSAQSTSSMTFEIDFKTSNIVDEDESIVRICKDYLGDIWGFEMRPLECAVLTNRTRERFDQNTTWAEGIRTRITLNVVYDLYNGLNYARIFVNDRIEREFTYTSLDTFIDSSDAASKTIVIGNTYSDIDIFGIRCYQKALSASDVMRDYKAHLSTSSEKVAFAIANAIVGSDGRIDYNLAKNAGLNVIGHKNLAGASLPMYGNKVTNTGNVELEIYIHNDPSHSGTISGDDIENKGQGTTAMGYYFWNQQYKFGDNTKFTDANGNQFSGYPIAEGEALAKKLVGKINFASSMQNHKLGLTWAYTDIFKKMVSNSTMSEPGQITLQSNARLSVFEKPFLFFEWDNATNKYVFRSLMTFGAGKGDKPTFGFNKNTTPNMMMVEGADNDKPLALFAMPWDDTVTYDTEDEAWKVNSQKNINFGFGVTSNDIPASTPYNAIKDFFNFVYLHNSRIRYYNGTLTQLNNGEEQAQQFDDVTLGIPNNLTLYWVTTADSGANKYDLVRYNGTRWIAAGINGATLNLRTQYESLCSDLGIVPQTFPANNLSTNNLIIETRRAHFKANAANYIHLDDAMYHYCFIKFFAGTDNRAKNTYYYTDPSDLKIRWMQDDLDTVLKTNNLGQNRKPYYIEEHDKYGDAVKANYWQGENCGFYCLLEECYVDEIVVTMRNMLTAMSSLGGGSLEGFMAKYILYVQDYYPGTAYNENARAVYETAALYYGTTYTGVANPLTQSCGSQRWSEYQWLKDRIMYISSYCEYGEFSGNTDAAGSLIWSGGIGNYSFTLTPAKWLYPRISQGGSNLYPATGQKRVRVQAGQAFNYQQFYNGSDSRIAIKGINYYWEIGDMNMPLEANSRFTFTGKRLRKIEINPNATNSNVFLASTIAVEATNIMEFIVRNVTSLTAPVDLSGCTRLQTIDMRGCTTSEVTLPPSNVLTSVKLPAVITLSLSHLPNLSTLELEGYGNLTSVSVDCPSVNYDALTLINFIKNSNAMLSNLTLTGVEWTSANSKNVAASVVDYMCQSYHANIYGRIDIVPSEVISYDQKMSYLAKWGNIDNAQNPLYITYTQIAITAFAIGGDTYVTQTGEYQYVLTFSESMSGNDVSSVSWAVKASEAVEGTPDYNINDYISGISDGKVTITNIDGSNNRDFIITATIHKADGTTVEDTYTVGMYYHPKTVLDYVYHDATWSDRFDPSRTLVGVCYDVITYNNVDYGMCVCTKQSGATPWGLYNNGIMANITLSDSSYNVYDTPLPNIGSQSQAPETIIEFQNPVLGHTGISTQSMFNTLTIIIHRNKIMSDPNIDLGDYIPETLWAVENAKGNHITKYQAIALADTKIREEIKRRNPSYTDANLSTYLQILYYPATKCYAYEPAVKDGQVLSDKFKAGMWALSVLGSSNANGIWKILKMKANGDFDAAVQTGKFDDIINGANQNYWSSTECTASTAWFVHYSGNSTFANNNKGAGYYTRPVALF